MTWNFWRPRENQALTEAKAEAGTVIAEARRKIAAATIVLAESARVLEESAAIAEESLRKGGKRDQH